MLARVATVLLTGFEPFAEHRENPSAQIAEALDGRSVERHAVRGVVLPVIFREALAELRAAITRHRPALVVCLGQGGGRPSIGVERVAINVDDALLADNAGSRPIDEPVVRNGPVGYWSTLPVKAIVKALRDAGIPAEVSQTAGTFVCNHVFYGLMHTLGRKKGVRGGFVHVPYLPEQAARLAGSPPGLALTEQLRAIELVVATSLTTKRDLRVSGGALD
jgi:pyroglutamyl-peptidase